MIAAVGEQSCNAETRIFLSEVADYATILPFEDYLYGEGTSTQIVSPLVEW
jgi:hypothetical protein